MNNPHICSIALFCGSTAGHDVRYRDLAAELGRQCASRGVTLYYGGAKIGLMGAAAETALAGGGRVVGVIPDFFSGDAVVAQNITEQIWVKSMSERKQTLERLADAFVVLPGAFGTMDELFEVLTDAQLGLHRKPIVVLNAFGYYDHLIKQLEMFEKEGFLRTFHSGLRLIATSVEEVFTAVEDFSYSNDPAWLEKYMRLNKR